MDAPTNALIADVVWVGRGIAKAIPDKVQLDNKDLQELLEGGNLKDTSEDSENESGDENPEKTGLRGSITNLANDSEDYNLDDYDKEDSNLKGPSMKGLAYYASQMDDPYITRHQDSEEEEEKEDFELKPTDNLVAVAKTAKDDYSIDVYVYNEDNDDWYMHHDYILEAPPLCLAHIAYDPTSEETGGKGNFLAVGTMEPTIGIWDLNVVNTLEPVLTLGEKVKKIKKKGEKSRKRQDGSAQGHTDAVLSLSWNANLDHLLASGSSDSTVVLWDLDETKAAQVLQLNGMVQSLQWHPFEAGILMAGTRSGAVTVINCKEDSGASRLTWSMGNGNVEVENVLWNRHQPYYAFVCANDGTLRYLDTRKPGEFVAEVIAHEDGTNSVSHSFHVRNLLATAGSEEIKVWRLENNTTFRLIYTRPMKMGAVRAVRFSPDSGCVLAVGANGEDNARVLDLAAIDPVVQAFNAASAAAGGVADGEMPIALKQRPVNDEQEEDEEDNEEMQANDGDDSEDEEMES